VQNIIVAFRYMYTAASKHYSAMELAGIWLGFLEKD